MIDGDGFQVVKRGKRQRAIKAKKQPVQKQPNHYIDINKCRKQIDECLRVLDQSAFYKSFINTFSHACKCTDIQCKETGQISGKNNWEFREMVVYGIGSLADSIISRYQFALVQLLALKYQLRCFLFDPVLRESEKMLIEEYHIELIKENEECKRRVSEATVFMMLHCGKAMYNNLLWSNWNNLRGISIVGNSFSSYLERIPSREMEISASYIKKALTFTKQYAIKNSFIYDDIFNDSSIHTFPYDLLCTADPTMWQDAKEPVCNHDDTEIIKNKGVD